MQRIETNMSAPANGKLRSSGRKAVTGMGLAAAAALLALSGCSGSNSGANSSNAPGLAGGTSSLQYHTYVGTQSIQWVTPPGQYIYGGVWTFSLDDNTKYFTYRNVTHQGSSGPDALTTIGQSAGSGFLSLTPNGAAAGSGGYALEIPGQASMLRAGNATQAPVISVQADSCLTLSSPVTYQFITLGTPDPTDPNQHGAYGSIQASSSGANWTFTNYKMYAFDGTDLQPTALPPGACGATAEDYAITIERSAATNNLPLTAQVSSNGFFIFDQGQGDPSLEVFDQQDVVPGPTGPLGLVGVQQPSSQLNTGSLVGAKYLGFEYDPIDDTLGIDQGAAASIFGTLPVSFSGGSGTTMAGGDYPNDDVTQTPNADITIDLGPQDTQNGLYKTVTVTVPDTYQACAFTPFGVQDAAGNWVSCVFHGEAIAGTPGGKNAIFVTVNDLSQTSRNNTQYAALDFILYQQ